MALCPLLRRRAGGSLCPVSREGGDHEAHHRFPLGSPELCELDPGMLLPTTGRHGTHRLSQDPEIKIRTGEGKKSPTEHQMRNQMDSDFFDSPPRDLSPSPPRADL